MSDSLRAAVAYLFPPLSGLIVYFTGSTARIRLHGLQSVAFGVFWPASLYVCSWLSPTATRVAFAAGALVLLVLLLTTASGKNLRLPGVGPLLASQAGDSPASGASSRRA